MKTLFALLSISLLFSQQRDFMLMDETISTEMQNKSVAGAAFAVIRGDSIWYANAYGIANTETKEQVGTEHLFRLGSTTKMFVATAALMLAEQKRLDLHVPIATYLRDLPQPFETLTMYQLLTHTAGLFDDFPMEGPDDDSALTRMILSWKPEYQYLTPGEFFSYSNPGYWLAGRVIESIARIPFADAMNEILFRPLGMRHSMFRLQDAVRFPLAAGHDKSYSVLDPPANHAGTYPSGSMYSTVSDVSTFLTVLLNDGMWNGRQLLPGTVVRQLLTPQVETKNPNGARYGFGLMFEMRKGKEYVFHNGARSGYGSIIRLIPSERFAVVILANRTSALLSVSADVATSLSVELDQKENRNEAFSYIDRTSSQFEGDFFCPPHFTMEFFQRGILHVKRGWHRAPIKQYSDNSFSDHVYPFSVTRSNDGTVQYVHMEWHTLRRKENKP